jgi:hypothetical protein
LILCVSYHVCSVTQSIGFHDLDNIMAVDRFFQFILNIFSEVI